MSLHSLTTLAQSLDPAFLVLSGTIALLTFAVARKLFRLARAKLAKNLPQSSDGKSP